MKLHGIFIASGVLAATFAPCFVSREGRAFAEAPGISTVDEIVITKSSHDMVLMSGTTVLRRSTKSLWAPIWTDQRSVKAMAVRLKAPIRSPVETKRAPTTCRFEFLIPAKQIFNGLRRKGSLPEVTS
jgi:hypothetical protein